MELSLSRHHAVFFIGLRIISFIKLASSAGSQKLAGFSRIDDVIYL